LLTAPSFAAEHLSESGSAVWPVAMRGLPASNASAANPATPAHAFFIIAIPFVFEVV
jgi:hypothetical protein